MNKRPSLSDVLPAKGAATRSEPLPDEAPPESTPPARPLPEGRKTKAVRVPVTVKIRDTVYARLREASFREEVDKQDLVDQALDALLSSMGY